MEGCVCGSHDSTVRVWDEDSGVCGLTIITESGVLSLAIITDGKVCIGLVNGTLKIYSVIEGVCEMTMRGHTGRKKSSFWSL
jgi:WD40 repeat protein